MKQPSIRFAMLLPIVLLISATVAVAQDKSPFEVFGGYSYLNSDIFNDVDAADFGVQRRNSAHGFEGAVVGNFSKWAGVKFDFSYHRGHIRGADSEVEDVGHTVNQFLVGIQVKNNKKDGPAVKPFGHLLAGVARQKVNLEDIGDENIKFTDFAMVFGGGVDIRAGKHLDVRVIQIDYNIIDRRDHNEINLPGKMQNNFRFSVGLVFR